MKKIYVEIVYNQKLLDLINLGVFDLGLDLFALMQ